VQNRLQLRLSRATLILLGLALLGLSAPGWAQRQLPKDAHFGEMTRFAYPQAVIGKHTFRMAPGARIYNYQNLTITPSAMPPKAQVLFRVDGIGQLSGIWLLTAQEAAKYKKPTTGWTPSTPSSPKPGNPKPGNPKPGTDATKDATPVDPSRTGR